MIVCEDTTCRIAGAVTVDSVGLADGGLELGGIDEHARDGVEAGSADSLAGPELKAACIGEAEEERGEQHLGAGEGDRDADAGQTTRATPAVPAMTSHTVASATAEFSSN